MLLILMNCRNPHEKLNKQVKTKEVFYQNKIENKVKISPINYNKDSSIAITISKKNESELDTYRGINLYKCYIANNNLKISLSWGMLSGTTLDISINSDSIHTRYQSWGCTSSEEFSYITLHQKLLLLDRKYLNNDTIVGYLEYRGQQDINSKIEKLKGYGYSTEGLETKEPTYVEVKGYFKFKLFEDENTYSTSSSEYYEQRFRSYQLQLDSLRKNLTTSLDASSLELERIPAEIIACKNLEYLKVKENFLKNEDLKVLSKLPKLRSLDISDNNLIYFPTEIFGFKSIKSINIRGNEINKIPVKQMLDSGIKSFTICQDCYSSYDIDLLKGRINIDYDNQ